MAVVALSLRLFAGKGENLGVDDHEKSPWS